MQQKNSCKFAVSLAAIIGAVICDILFVTVIIGLSVLLFGNVTEVMFWIFIAIAFILLLGLIWLNIIAWSFVTVTNENIVISCYNGKYVCPVQNIENIELKTDHRGVKFIIVHFKKPVFLCRNKKVINKSKESIGLFENVHTIEIMKKFYPENAVCWVYNDLFHVKK